MSQLRAVAAGFGWRSPPPPAGARAVLVAIGAGVLAAWVAMLGMLAMGTIHHAALVGGGAPSPATPGMSAMVGMSSVGAHGSMLLGSSTGRSIEMWALMVVAMMLPSALPAVRHVGANSLRWRRRRAMATFVAGYAAIWIALGAASVVILRLSSLPKAAIAPAVALALAAAWQLTPYKRRALSDCHRPSPLPPRGRRAAMGVLRFASRGSLACVRSCWALMLAMGLAQSMPIFWMVAVTGIVTVEKFAPKPRQATRISAALLAVAAFISGLSALTP
jgi:predicted metal-binding membrane protein